MGNLNSCVSTYDTAVLNKVVQDVMKMSKQLAECMAEMESLKVSVNSTGRTTSFPDSPLLLRRVLHRP